MVLTGLNGLTAGKCCQTVFMTSLRSLLRDSCCQAVFLMSLNGPTTGECRQAVVMTSQNDFWETDIVMQWLYDVYKWSVCRRVLSDSCHDLSM